MEHVPERLRQEGIFMVSVIYGEPALQPLYERFGFRTLRCGQMEMRPGRETDAAVCPGQSRKIQSMLLTGVVFRAVKAVAAVFLRC